MVVNVYKRTNMKIYFNEDFQFTSNRRKSVVSMQEKHIAYIYIYIFCKSVVARFNEIANHLNCLNSVLNQ